MIEKKAFEEYIKTLSFDERIESEILELYDYNRDKNNTPVKKIEKVLNDIFNPNRMYSQPFIPLEFMYTPLGELILELILCVNQKPYTIGDLAEITKKSRQYFSNLIRDEKLKPIKEGGMYRIHQKDAEELIQKIKES